MGRYAALLEHLSIAPVRFDSAPEMEQILDIVLEPGDQELLLALGRLPALHGAANAARRTGVSRELADRRLADLADRGVIARVRVLGRDLYALLPLMPGFFEFTFMKHDNYPPEVKQSLRELWSRYKRGHLTAELLAGETLPQRVLPINQSLAPDQVVLRQDDVLRLIQGASKISLGRCACREAERKCDHEIETCFGINSFAVLMTQNGFAREVSVAKARTVLHEAAEAGLVHAALNCVRHSLILCNCCGCCCVTLNALSRMGLERGMAPSSVCAAIDQERCTDCGRCVERCWVKAITVNEQVRIVDQQRCLGCGVCQPTCPSGAISMQARPGFRSATPASGLALLKRMTDERQLTGRMIKAVIHEMV